ncbi:MAG: alpha-L-fucosidase [Phycisphaerales bacterium]
MLRRALAVLAAVVLGGCAGSGGGGGVPDARVETPEEHAARMAWWREARFGMFIHWGLYAIPAGQWDGKKVGGTGEWIQTNAPIQVADYEPLRDRFNPVLFDADAWVLAAKRAGMKYVVITTKHHDGFALFDSKVSDWDIASTPFKRDIMGEIAEACRRHGMRIGWYHSIMDWHHPDYLPRRKWEVRSAEGADFERFCEYLKAQVSEIMRAYGPIDVLWFDGEWEGTWTHERGVELARHCRGLNPSVIINNRVDKGRNDMAGLDKPGEWAGDFGTPEQEVPARGLPGMDWESCMTMNDTWGYRSDDHNWKSTTTLIRTLCETASKGGNFLLNVGPTADGLVPEASLERLAEMGRWMDVNGQAIYGTRAGPFGKLPWGRCTQKGDDLYLMVFDWPADGRLVVPGLLNDVKSVQILGERTKRLWPAQREGEDVAVTVPAQPVHAAATVVKLTTVGKPSVVNDEPPAPKSGVKAGVVELIATDAVLDGPNIRYEEKRAALGYWTDATASAAWKVADVPAGTYDVVAELACKDSTAGSEAVFTVGGEELRLTVPATGDWGDFREVRVGKVTVPAGTLSVRVAASGAFKEALMNLRRVRLSPSK